MRDLPHSFYPFHPTDFNQFFKKVMENEVL